MKKIIPLFLITATVFIMISCQQKLDQQLLTERIQYDVQIKNPDADANWWVNNIVGPDREKLIKDIFNKAYSGEVRAYDYFNVLISPENVRKIGIDTTYKTMKRNVPPYDEFDTMIVTKLNFADITHLRFLEEWQINEKTLQITKKVMGIAPVKMVTVGGIDYSMPLFWIYLDEKYPAVLKN